MQSVSVDLGAADSTVYDVKIFFKENSGNLQSEIQTSSGWKNAYYYLQGAFPAQHIFSVRLKQYPSSGEAELCVRLRKQNATSYDEQCKIVSVENQSVPGQSSETTSQVQTQTPALDTPRQTTKPSTQTEVAEEHPTVENQNSAPAETNTAQTTAPIILRNEQPQLSTTPSQAGLTTQAKTRIVINYILAFVAVIALVVIIRRSNREL